MNARLVHMKIRSKLVTEEVTHIDNLELRVMNMWQSKLEVPPQTPIYSA